MKVLLAILALATIFRFYGLNWDQGHHLHPDERMIVLTTLKVYLPQTPEEQLNLFTPESPLNPKFFAYGSFPIYLLKAAGAFTSIFSPSLATYDGLNLVGRFISTLFDLGTIFLLYLLGKRLWKQSVGLLAALFYTLAVLPIQLSHFYAVDTPLTFFTILTLYLAVRFFDKPSMPKAILIGFIFGLALATKTSALLLLVPIATAFFLKLHSKPLLLTTYYSILTVITFAAFFIFEPFAIIDFSTFWSQTLEQQRMTRDAFTFPYTLQYVGKIPYLYELKNIFLWGLGPLLATISFIGVLFFTYKTFRPTLNTKYLILNTFFWLYLAVVGQFAIGFMRYILPLYPLFCLFAAFLIEQLLSHNILQKYKFSTLNTRYLLLIPFFIWPLSFLSIYSQPPTRVQASNWIYQNISSSSVLATEHWDDGLPFGRPILYPTIQLPLYDPETPQKWQKINQTLQTADYIIIASNRLYVPLRKLNNCEKLPLGRCYKETALYYEKLFLEELGFAKVAEFTNYPSIPLLNYTINDFSADESFTVYDHPKIMIFKKDPSPFAKVMIN